MSTTREPATLPTVQYGDFSLKVHERAHQQNRVIKAQLELTYRCNLHCAHCYTDPYNAREWFARELTLEEISRILDEMSELGILWLNLTGGEIFSRPDFFDIYEYAYHKGFLLQLYTNGTMLTEGIITRLQGSPPFSIDVSCHSVDEHAFDGFTQVRGSFKKFLKGMELLGQSGLPFSFKTKAMTWNKDELPAIKTFIESFGQPFGFTTSMSPRLDGDLSPLAYRLQPMEIREIQGAAGGNASGRDSCEESTNDVQSPPNRLFRCGCATDTIHISAWGELGTCTLQYERRASLREYSLREAIDKVFPEIRDLRYQTNSPCKACEIFAFCDKKPTYARWECSHPEAPIPYECDVALARAERVLQQPLIHPLALSPNEKGTQHG